MWKNFRVNGENEQIKLVKQERESCSYGHKKVREVLKLEFPFETIYEEVHIPSANLYLDFLIWNKSLVVEVDGKQHDNYVQYFHTNRIGFLKAQARDRLKEQILEENNLSLIRLKDGEEHKWQTQIQEFSAQNKI